MLTVKQIVCGSFCLVLLFVLMAPSVFNDNVDVATLTIPDLKALLDLRGTSYSGFVEKSDLVQLVNRAAVTLIELDLLREAMASAAAATDTIFVSGIDYKTRVESEDTTPWLVAVIVDGKFPMVFSEWQNIRKELAKLGVRTGQMDCQNNRKFCSSRKWTTSRLSIAYYATNNKNPKDDPDDPVLTEEGVLHWVLEKLLRNVRRVGKWEVSKLWPSSRDPSKDGGQQLILFTDRQSPPPFYPAVAALFWDKVLFYWVTVKSPQELLDYTAHSYLHRDLSKVLNSRPRNELFPLLVYVSSSGVYEYRGRGEECWSYLCLRNFLSDDPHHASWFLITRLLYKVIVCIGSCYKSVCDWLSLIVSRLPVIATCVCFAFIIIGVISTVVESIKTRLLGRPAPVLQERRQPDLTPEAMEQLNRYIHQLVLMQERQRRPVHDSATLPAWSYHRPQSPPDGYRQDAGDVKCSICLEEYMEKDRMSGLPCQHVFHYGCLVKWLNNAPSNTCPLCRR